MASIEITESDRVTMRAMLALANDSLIGSVMRTKDEQLKNALHEQIGRNADLANKIILSR